MKTLKILPALLLVLVITLGACNGSKESTQQEKREIVDPEGTFERLQKHINDLTPKVVHPNPPTRELDDAQNESSAQKLKKLREELQPLIEEINVIFSKCNIDFDIKRYRFLNSECKSVNLESFESRINQLLRDAGYKEFDFYRR